MGSVKGYKKRIIKRTTKPKEEKIKEIESLYLKLFNTDLDVELFASDFYFAVGEILAGKNISLFNENGEFVSKMEEIVANSFEE